MTLADYFSPLSIFNLALVFFVFYQLEIIGFFIASKLKFDEYSRFSWWILGLGFFVFFWFILHFFLPFNQAIILLTLSFLSGASLSYYVNNKGFQSFIKSIKTFPVAFLLLLLVIRRLSYWISAPPYSWDEMAYHYYPVSKLLFEKKWPFYNYEFYIMLPRFFETAYVLLFSVTKTQVAARLVHFGIFFSVIQSTAQFLRKKVSYLSASIFSILAIFLHSPRLIEATTGYIDVGVASLLVMASLSLVLLVKEKKSKYIFSLVIWLSLAAGSKYSVLLSVVAFSSLVLIFFIRDNYKKILGFFKQKNINKKPVKLLGLLFILATVFGGFWYFKNLFLTYNPIYPFVLPCKQGLDCGSDKSFFDGWTMSFSLSNQKVISLAVFQENLTLMSLTVFSYLAAFLIAFATKNKLVKILLSVIITSVLFEVLLASRVTGFLARYFLHWSLYIPIILALPWMKVWKPWPKDKNLKKSLVFLLLIVAATQFRRLRPIVFGQIEVFNQSKKMLPDDVKAYAKREIDIFEWTELSFPDYYPVIHWCADRKEETKLVMADPELIWTSGNGLARAFFVYCSFDTDLLNSDYSVNKKKIKQLIEEEAYLTSLFPCDNSKENLFEDKQKRAFFELNQELVCRSEKVVPGLYKIKK